MHWAQPRQHIKVAIANPQSYGFSFGVGATAIETQTVHSENVCEVCAKAVAMRGDLLCNDCSRAFTIMLGLIHGHPEVDVEDLDRIKQVFEWRMRKKGLLPSIPEVQEEERVLSAALSVLRRKQASAAQQPEISAGPAE